MYIEATRNVKEKKCFSYYIPRGKDSFFMLNTRKVIVGLAHIIPMLNTLIFLYVLSSLRSSPLASVSS